MSTDADLVLEAIGAVLGAVLGQVPIVGVGLKPVFGIIWGKLTETPKAGDVTKMLVGMIQSIKNYVDEKVQYAKEKNVKDAMAFFTMQADDLTVQIEGLPESAALVIQTHHECVNKAGEALQVLYDPEWGHITLHDYAIMASLYLSLLDDGIKDKNNWGIEQSLKNTYLDRRRRFFEAAEFSKLLGHTMDKAGQGILPLRTLTAKTTEVSKLWYCFNPQLYPLGVPEIIAADAANPPSNATAHVYLQPSSEKYTIVANNLPGGFVRQVLASRGDPWQPFYPDRRNASLLRLQAPDGHYPKAVKLRYYRIADAVATSFIGLDYELRVKVGEETVVDRKFPGEGAWEDSSKVIFQTEAVLLRSTNGGQFSDIFNRGQANAARLEYLELKNFTLQGPADIYIEWKAAASQAREVVYLAPVEFLMGP